jgi:hypothetical protein
MKQTNLHQPPYVGNEDLVDWLKDVARRGAPKSPAPSNGPVPPVVPPRHSGNGRPLFMGALAAIAVLQYVYVDAYLQIARLTKLIVFVAVP